jgi:hypothetical protein
LYFMNPSSEAGYRSAGRGPRKARSKFGTQVPTFFQPLIR